MSTFFEKLTGSPSQASKDDNFSSPEEYKKTSSRAASPPEEPKEVKRISVTEEGKTAAEEEQTEEEGELTVDIYDKGDAIIIQSTVAGVKPEDLDIATTTDTVTIRGKRERSETIEEKNYFYKELFWGIFSRSIILPEEIEEDLAEATYKHGLLTLRLPKKRRGVVQKVKVRVT